jgi:hypothetical protein
MFWAVEISNFQKQKLKRVSIIPQNSLNANMDNALYRQPAAHRCKNGCIYEILATFCEFGTFIGNIYDWQCSISFLINGDAKLGFGLLKCDIFRGKSQSVFLSNLE